MTKPKPHLSPSSMDMYTRCGEAFRRRYVEGEIIPPGIAMLKGTGVHRAAEMNMRQKIESHVDLPQNEIVDAAVSAFESETHGGYLLTPEESSRGAKLVISQATGDLVDMATVHAQLQAPDYQPVATEQLVRIELPNSPRDLLGVIDLIDDQDRVTDFKTSGRAKSQADADSSVQLSVYSVLFQALTGREPKELRLDTIVTTATRTGRKVVSTQRGPDNLEILANRFNAVLKGVQAGIFTPAAPGSWWCATKFCGYAMTCPYFPKHREQNEVTR